MADDSRWIRFLAGRVVVHAILGSLFCAFFGAALIATCGVIVGWALSTPSPPGTSTAFYISSVELMKLGAAIGASFGGGGGGLVGAIALGIIGFISPPRRSRLPAKSVLSRILLAMTVATCAVMVSFFVFVGFLTIVRHSDFQSTLGDGLPVIMYGSPLVMLCGLICGAVIASRQQTRLARAQSASL